jgi:hypothetical protein
MTHITAGLAQQAMQTAMYDLLVGDAELQLLVARRVFDAVPDATVDDYVAFGEWTEASDDTLEDGNAGVGAECTVTIHGYSDDSRGAAGYKKVQAIMSRVKVILHGRDLALVGWASVTCEHEDTVVIRDEDTQGRSKRHGISTYRVIAEALSS